MMMIMWSSQKKEYDNDYEVVTEERVWQWLCGGHRRKSMTTIMWRSQKKGYDDDYDVVTEERVWRFMAEVNHTITNKGGLL